MEFESSESDRKETILNVVKMRKSKENELNAGHKRLEGPLEVVANTNPTFAPVGVIPAAQFNYPISINPCW